jgi:hypothetical protein
VNQLLSKRNLLALAALLAGLLLVLYFVPQSQLAARDPLIEIQTVETLRAQFNRDAGKTRLILLLSPT